MANQHSNRLDFDAEARRDLDALPIDLQPLYQRLVRDGADWRATSSGRLAALAQTLAHDAEERTAAATAAEAAEYGSLLTLAPRSSGTPTPPTPPSNHQRRRQWIAGTFAVVAVVTLLTLVLQAGLGHGNTGPTIETGRWQIIDQLTWKRTSGAQELPSIAPSDPRVVYEATSSYSGQGGKAVTYASLRRTTDGGKTWKALTLPLPLADISLMTIRVSPLRAETVFLSLWDRSSIACEPTSGTVGEGCERGYLSTDSGDSWQKQTLPVRGVLDTGGPIVAQDGRLYAQNVCNDDSCLHLIMSTDGGLTWQVVDQQITASKQHICDLATTSGQTVYAVTSPIDCAKPLNSETLWRSDDAGAHWTPLGLPHRAPFNQMFTLLSNTLLTAPGTAHPSLIYLNKPYVTTNVGPSFEYSEDRGVTWKTTPTVPDVPICASSDEPCDSALPLAIGEAAVLSDGSLLYFPFEVSSKPMTPWVWKPGDGAWHRLPRLPDEVTGPGSIIVTPGANGHDTITMALRASGDASNPVAYYVARYQL